MKAIYSTALFTFRYEENTGIVVMRDGKLGYVKWALGEPWTQDGPHISISVMYRTKQKTAMQISLATSLCMPICEVDPARVGFIKSENDVDDDNTPDDPSADDGSLFYHRCSIAEEECYIL